MYVRILDQAPGPEYWSTEHMRYVSSDNPDFIAWKISDNTLLEFDTEIDADAHLASVDLYDKSPLPSRIITTLTFIDRFTDEELLAILAAAPSTVIRVLSASVVDVTDTRITSTIDALIVGGVINSDRRDLLLSRLSRL